MGTVVNISTARQARRQRAADVALAVAMHPALRWHAGGDTTLGHRRTPTGRTVCGVTGDLRVADAPTERCPACYAHLPGTG